MKLEVDYSLLSVCLEIEAYCAGGSGLQLSVSLDGSLLCRWK